MQSILAFFSANKLSTFGLLTYNIPPAEQLSIQKRAVLLYLFVSVKLRFFKKIAEVVLVGTLMSLSDSFVIC